MVWAFVDRCRATVREEFGFALAMPAVIWQVFFLMIPAVILFYNSLVVEGQSFLSFANYEACFNKYFFLSVWNSISLAFTSATLCLFFCLPLALIIHFQVPRKYRSLLLFSLMMPSWTNFIIRIYSWFFLLRNNGLLFNILSKLSLLQPGSSLLANYVATQAVMVYCYFQFMLLPIYDAVSSIDPSLFEASADLGASSWVTFWRVTIPKTLRGIFFGFLIVLLAAFGEFAIPEFIGGAKVAYWGNLVVNSFVFYNDYNHGGAVMFLGIASLFVSILFMIGIFKVSLELLSNFVDIPRSVLSFRFLLGGDDDK